MKNERDCDDVDSFYCLLRVQMEGERKTGKGVSEIR